MKIRKQQQNSIQQMNVIKSYKNSIKCNVYNQSHSLKDSYDSRYYTAVHSSLCEILQTRTVETLH